MFVNPTGSYFCPLGGFLLNLLHFHIKVAVSVVCFDNNRQVKSSPIVSLRGQV